MTTKTAYFMMGGPASGKSTVRKNRFAELFAIDCDAIKEQLDGYDPKHPETLHEESKAIAQKQFTHALSLDNSFVYDGTGVTVENMVYRMNAARANGFAVALIYVPCDLATALQRNAARTRTVPESIVREKYSLIATSFEIVSRYADSVEVINNK